jgi:nucleotidyltransferase/DNA polymerase involved in DNA repair
LSKISSKIKDLNPRFQVEIKPEEVQDFLRDLPISKLWGVGKSTEAV